MTHDFVYGKYRYLVKRKKSDKFFRDKAFKISNNLKYNEDERVLTSMVYNFLIRNLLSTGI